MSDRCRSQCWVSVTLAASVTHGWLSGVTSIGVPSTPEHTLGLFRRCFVIRWDSAKKGSRQYPPTDTVSIGNNRADVIRFGLRLLHFPRGRRISSGHTRRWAPTTICTEVRLSHIGAAHIALSAHATGCTAAISLCLSHLQWGDFTMYTPVYEPSTAVVSHHYTWPLGVCAVAFCISDIV